MSVIGTIILEFTADIPQKYALVCHALAIIIDRSKWGTITSRGEATPETFGGHAYHEGCGY